MTCFACPLWFGRQLCPQCSQGQDARDRGPSLWETLIGWGFRHWPLVSATVCHAAPILVLPTSVVTHRRYTTQSDSPSLDEAAGWVRKVPQLLRPANRNTSCRLGLPRQSLPARATERRPEAWMWLCCAKKLPLSRHARLTRPPGIHCQSSRQKACEATDNGFLLSVPFYPYLSFACSLPSYCKCNGCADTQIAVPRVSSGRGSSVSVASQTLAGLPQPGAQENICRLT